MSISEKEMKANLFQRTYNLEQEVIQAKELQKELKEEFEYHKEFNTGGLPKDQVKKVMFAAKSKAKQDNLKQKVEDLLEIDALIDELSS